MTALEIAAPWVRVQDVRVGERARRDYGDLSKLTASIAEHGLLQPIVLLPDNYLLCGGRRLEAVKQLGWESIPCVVSTTQTDAMSRLRAERDENTCRKDMTPSELVALGLKLEQLKQPEADARQGTRTDLTCGPNGPQVGIRPDDGHSIRRDVAEAVGMSEGTYKRAKRVVEVAEDETAPEPVRVVAVAARAEMDAGTLTISGAEKKVKAAQDEAQSPSRQPLAVRLDQIRALAPTGQSSRQIAQEIGVGEDQVRKLARDNGIHIPADTTMGRTRILDANRVISATVMDASNVVSESLLAQINFADLDREQLGEWVSSLSESVKALQSLKKSLEKELHRV